MAAGKWNANNSWQMLFAQGCLDFMSWTNIYPQLRIQKSTILPFLLVKGPLFGLYFRKLTLRLHNTSSPGSYCWLLLLFLWARDALREGHSHWHFQALPFQFYSVGRWTPTTAVEWRVLGRVLTGFMPPLKTGSADTGVVKPGFYPGLSCPNSAHSSARLFGLTQSPSCSW